MGTRSSDGGTSGWEPWEEEVLAMHRWGRLSFWFKIDDNRGKEEHARLRKLWELAQPLDESSMKVIDQILSLEICNWNLEEGILVLCSAIGKKVPTTMTVGHMASLSDERWKKVWAYYLTLRNWLLHEILGGYETLLRMCDPENEVQNYILDMLGERTELKEFYVERFCLCLERWISGYSSTELAQMKAHHAAISSIEKEIEKLDPKRQVIPELVLKADGDGRLQPCNHKAFRRYDLIISSIGAGKWRAVMPRRGIDGFDRAATLEKYLSPIESWIQSKDKGIEKEEKELFDSIHASLGEPDATKLFLASLLVSLLRSQQLAARKLAEKRMEKS